MNIIITICYVISARTRESPIVGIQLQLFVTGYLRHSRVNYARSNGFLVHAFCSILRWLPRVFTSTLPIERELEKET